MHAPTQNGTNMLILRNIIPFKSLLAMTQFLLNEKLPSLLQSLLAQEEKNFPTKKVHEVLKAFPNECLRTTHLHWANS